MGPLVDTDAFCKLAIGNILADSLQIFGVSLGGCGRLPALPHMLRRGRLRKKLGGRISDELLPLAESIPVIRRPHSDWLDRLTPVPSIDPGEAQILALAAEEQRMVLSGDKRALDALKGMPEFVEALAGRIVMPDAILLELCDMLGTQKLIGRVQRLLEHDKMIQVCFSPNNPDPKKALASYYRSSVSRLAPLTLWSPGGKGATS